MPRAYYYTQFCTCIRKSTKSYDQDSNRGPLRQCFPLLHESAAPRTVTPAQSVHFDDIFLRGFRLQSPPTGKHKRTQYLIYTLHVIFRGTGSPPRSKRVQVRIPPWWGVYSYVHFVDDCTKLCDNVSAIVKLVPSWTRKIHHMPSLLIHCLSNVP